MMMYEKNIFIVCLSCCLLFMLAGCCTGAGIRDNGDGAYRVRAHIGELSDKQTESAITSEQLNGTVEGARETSENLSGALTTSRTESERLTQSITDGASDLERLANILQRIRKRGDAENGGDANRDR